MRACACNPRLPGAAVIACLPNLTAASLPPLRVRARPQLHKLPATAMWYSRRGREHTNLSGYNVLEQVVFTQACSTERAQRRRRAVRVVSSTA